MNNFSKLGFILATLGSSIGLGHIWRFPYIAGEYGGSAFVLMYIILTLCIGVPIVVAKMVIGNKTQKNVINAINELDTTKRKHWRKSGLMILGGPLILAFYAVVLGWAFYYLFVVSFDLPSNALQSQAIFDTLKTEKIFASIVSFGICMFLTAYVVSKGVKNGLEKFNFILMPLLFFIFIGLFFYALTMPKFNEAIDFLFAFKLDKITPSVVIMALSQVFFSLSIGVGTLITYSSVAKKGENLLSSAIWIAISGIIVSVIAGIIIFTFLFSNDLPANSGEGMLFVSLPMAFGGMAYGNIISMLFFIAILFAGITSTISILEPPVAYLESNYQINRKKAAYWICLAVSIVGILVILSFTNDYKSYLTWFDKSLFVWVDFITSAIIMPLGGLTALLLLAFVVGKQRTYKFVRKFMNRAVFNAWFFIIKYIAPIVIVAILVMKFIDTFAPKESKQNQALLDVANNQFCTIIS